LARQWCGQLKKVTTDWSILLAGRNELDLLDQSGVEKFLSQERPDFVINAAAKVGGIYANSTYPAEFMHQNLLLNANLIHSAWKNGVSRFLNLGSSCIYPCRSQQPIKEDYLLTGPLEKTNEAYALAKIAGSKCVGITVRNMEFFFIVRCLLIFMVLEIIITPKTLMYYPL
jgi:GDP-L-fucose synthase